MKKIVLSALVLSVCGIASATEESPWSFRIGVTSITPHVTSGDLSAASFMHTTSSISSATQLTGGINYRLSDRWSVDVPLGLPFKHDIYGDGAIKGVGKIGSTKALPATTLMQYRLTEGNTAFQPYVGAGLTYAKFFGQKSTNTLTSLTGGKPDMPTTLSIESKIVPSVQLGAKWKINDVWALDINYIQTFLSTRTTLSTGQTLDAKLDPGSLSIGLSRGFSF